MKFLVLFFVAGPWAHANSTCPEMLRRLLTHGLETGLLTPEDLRPPFAPFQNRTPTARGLPLARAVQSLPPLLDPYPAVHEALALWRARATQRRQAREQTRELYVGSIAHRVPGKFLSFNGPLEIAQLNGETWGGFARRLRR